MDALDEARRRETHHRPDLEVGKGARQRSAIEEGGRPSPAHRQ
jgi:hypothetical protein